MTYVPHGFADPPAPTRRGLVLAGGEAALLVAASAVGAPRSDAEMLGGLLSMERRLEAAYEASLRHSALDEQLALSLRDQEREHVRGLEQLLAARGRQAPSAPSGDRRLARALANPEAFGRYALALEGRAVSAYVDVAAGVGDVELLEALGAIMTSEAQHRVALRRALRGWLLGV